MSDEPEVIEEPKEEPKDEEPKGFVDKVVAAVTPKPKPKVMATEPEVPESKPAAAMEAKAPATTVTLEKNGTKLEASHPTMARKYRDAVAQKRPGAKKYFRSR